MMIDSSQANTHPAPAASKRWRSAVLVCRLATLIAILVLTVPALAQDEGSAPVLSLDGTEAFSQMLHAQGLKAISIDKLATFPAKETLIVVFGDPACLTSIQERIGNLKGFLDEGGAVLVATDWPYTFSQDFGALSITGETVRALADPQFAYQGNLQCPVIRDFEPGHPLFKSVTRLVTIRPSKILYKPGETGRLQPLAGFGIAEQNLPPGMKSTFILGSSGEGDNEGRMLVVAGLSCFINRALIFSKADNATFAKNCADWLTDNHVRKYCLFVEDGSVRDKLDTPLERMPLPDEVLINLILQTIDEENLANRYLLAIVPKDLILHWLLLGLTVPVLIRLLYRLFASRSVREPGLPLTSRTLELTTSKRPLMVQRHDILTSTANLTEIAGSVIGSWLEECGLANTVKPPHVEAAAGARASRRWQREIDELWELAHGRSRRPVGPDRFRTILQRLGRARQAMHNGQLRLQPTRS
jgi:hypothetical protein